MYHRILPEEQAQEGVQAGMYVIPDTFRMHLEFLEKYFYLAPISLLHADNLKIPAANGKPCCFLTFDDGWYDFYQHAYPILKKYRAPATVFLPTDFIGTNNSFWTDRLAYLLCKLDKAGRPAGNSGDKVIDSLESLKGSFDSRLEQAIAELKKYRPDDIEDILSTWAARYDCNYSDMERSFLNWDEVREMLQSGLVTFGSHTAHHHILTTLTGNEIMDELYKSKKRLLAEAVADTSFIPFCYPNGNFDAEIADMVKEAGYSLAVTTKNGWNSIKPDNPYMLKRVGMHQDISSTRAMVGFKLLSFKLLSY